MVGHKFMEALKEKDPSNKFNVVTFCEENRAAYNRMRLTEVSASCHKGILTVVPYHIVVVYIISYRPIIYHIVSSYISCSHIADIYLHIYSLFCLLFYGYLVFLIDVSLFVVLVLI